MTAPSPAASSQAAPWRCWEDVVADSPRRLGPLSVSVEVLDQQLTLLGEGHPLHTDDTFARAVLGRRRRVVPGGLLHGVVAGWLVRREGPVAVAALRSVHWDFVRPVHPGDPFWCDVSVRRAEVLDARTGTIHLVRRLTDEQGRAYAIGRLDLVVLRRGAVGAVAASGDNCAAC